jgi:plastocyanin
VSGVAGPGLRWTRLAVAVAMSGILAGAAAGCGGGSSSSRPAAGTAAAAVTAVRGADGVQRVTVEARDDYRFSPATIDAATGPMEITVRNVGKVPHNLVLRGVPGGSVDYLDGGASKVITFPVSQPGRLPFVCTYHEAMGMVGTLVVH